MPKSKRPTRKKGWNTLRVTRETIPQFFDFGQNVGGLWGEPSGWIVDIDLDWPEASAVAPYLLPETFIYGRHSSPGSHYLYRCEGIETSKFQDPQEGMIVEIRSTGSQSVLPPSIHPDNERYEINHDVPFKSLTRRELVNLIKSVAAASVLVRCYPSGGGRHDYIHAITGTLLWGGWKEDRARTFLTAILEGVDDKEDDRQQRERTINNTIEHFHKGDKIAGWKTLSQWLEGPMLGRVREWLAMKADEVVPSTVKEVKSYSLDKSLMEVPGLVGELAEWSRQRSYLYQPLFDLAVGLMCTAIATTNKYVIDGPDTPLQPYFMILAPTSGGKGATHDNIFFFLRKIGLHEYAFKGFQSYHSMLDRLSSPPNMACWLWDEAARHLRSAKGNGPDNQVLTWILSLYGQANSSSPGVPGRHHAVPSIDYPFLTVCGAAQPQQLIEAITDVDISTGLVNRFVLFDTGDQPPEKNLKRQHTLPARIEEAVRRIREVQTPPGDFPFVRVKFEDVKTSALFDDFDTESRRSAYSGGGAEMWGRSNQNALILAGIVAVGIEPRRPMITEKIADWAIRFVRWSSTRWAARIDDASSRSVTELRSKTIERALRQPRYYIGRVDDPKLKGLLDRGLFPRSLLARICRHMTARDRDDALDNLVLMNSICTGEVDGVDVYWCRNE